MAETSALVAKRGSVKASITRIEKFIDDISDDVTVNNLKSRLKHLEELYAKYDDIQLNLEVINQTDFGDDRESIEDKYLNLKGRFEDLIEQKLAISVINSGVRSVNETSEAGIDSISGHLNENYAGLPKISLPQFDGDYDKWQNFKDLFTNLVHDCANVSKIRKLYYLKSALRGEASRLIECLYASEQNYDKAWETLTKGKRVAFARKIIIRFCMLRTETNHPQQRRRWARLIQLGGKQTQKILETAISEVCSTSVNTSAVSLEVNDDKGIVLWPIAIVIVIDDLGNKYRCRALLDSASERNYVTEEFVSNLNIDRLACDWRVSGVSGVSTRVKDTMCLTVQSRVSDFKFSASFGIMRDITGHTPRCEFDLKGLKWPRHISLADPTFNKVGIVWNPVSDSFEIAIGDSTVSDESNTKRAILSCIARIFDPLGFMGPITTRSKIVMQDIWKEKLDWDQQIPSHILKVWLPFKNQLLLLRDLSISRLMICENGISIQLHGFSDASMKAYGAVIFLLSEDKEGNVRGRVGTHVQLGARCQTVYEEQEGYWSSLGPRNPRAVTVSKQREIYLPGFPSLSTRVVNAQLRQPDHFGLRPSMLKACSTRRQIHQQMSSADASADV
ncbi:hypothetical protein NQ318_014733 [Aromia moschata]|uniref:Peptidase aspartic putative domain-containing protein n=1 Tax=Aromia moschata TaxID=1265417 RepID=A0AAV8ZCV7_9CUCU|nr:hypothetical protein NQ318_014733 [Aromia moschata]